MTKTRLLHLVLMILWTVMIVPVLTIWQNSILLVLIMSLYANLEVSATAFIASKKKKPVMPRAKSRIKGSSNIAHMSTTYYSSKRI